MLRDPFERRLLIIYDFSSQPFSVGDILVMQEAALVLRTAHGLDRIDFACVYDEEQPALNDLALAAIDSESFLFHLSSVLPAAQVNRHLGSIFLFDSHRRLKRFIAQNLGSYEVWPRLLRYATREYLFYHCMNDLFPKFHARHGCLPHLASRAPAQAWAARFIREFSKQKIVGTVQLRRNPSNPSRDSVYHAWREFFRYCERRYPVTFFVICAPDELDPELRSLPNVVCAKDHHTRLEQDLALIEAADFHMGASSGPATVAQFNSRPYCIFGWRIDPAVFTSIRTANHRHHFTFSYPFQSWIVEHENPALLRQEFQHMWDEILRQARARGRS